MILNLRRLLSIFVIEIYKFMVQTYNNPYYIFKIMRLRILNIEIWLYYDK